jgi:hypothetical protein
MLFDPGALACYSDLMHISLVKHAKYHNPENIFPFHLPVYLSVEGQKHAQRVAEWFKT